MEDDGEGGSVAFTGVRMLFPYDSGSRLPADVFTGAGPWVFGTTTVATFHRPGLTKTIAGYKDDAPEPGTPED